MNPLVFSHLSARWIGDWSSHVGSREREALYSEGGSVLPANVTYCWIVTGEGRTFLSCLKHCDLLARSLSLSHFLALMLTLHCTANYLIC